MELSEDYKKEYERYTNLILERDAALREAAVLQIQYVREFGSLSLRSFNLKLECAKQKKRLAYCQMMINHNRVIEQKKMNRFVANETGGLEQQLVLLKREMERARQAHFATEAEVLKTSALYRRLALKMHPEINPRTEVTPSLMEMWAPISEAYFEGDVTAMGMLLVQAEGELTRMREEGPFFIPDLKEKIIKLENQLESIRHSDPYRYKDLLKDPVLTKEKKERLQREAHDYKEILEGVGEKMDDIFHKRKVRFVVHMK